jgi:hypothetical protein
MAGAGYRLFVAGEKLTAAQVNTYFMQQEVMQFADASARNTALSAVLDEGLLSTQADANEVTIYSGSGLGAHRELRGVDRLHAAGRPGRVDEHREDCHLRPVHQARPDGHRVNAPRSHRRRLGILGDRCVAPSVHPRDHQQPAGGDWAGVRRVRFGIVARARGDLLDHASPTVADRYQRCSGEYANRRGGGQRPSQWRRLPGDVHLRGDDMMPCHGLRQEPW